MNVDCAAQRVQRIVFFAGRSAMDIEGLGEERVQQFVQAGLINDAADIYSLTVEQLVPLERIGERSAQLLVDAIDASRTRPLAKLLVGLGIFHVGPTDGRRAVAASSAASTPSRTRPTTSSSRSTASGRSSPRASARSSRSSATAS